MDALLAFFQVPRSVWRCFTDQMGDFECFEATTRWVQSYVAVMGALPDETEEPTPSQLAALHKRVFVDGVAPYVDFGVWGPYERKLPKTQRCRVFTRLGDSNETYQALDRTKRGWPPGECFVQHVSC